MKILVDQNISFRIIRQISSIFTQVEHVKSLNLINAHDYHIFSACLEIDYWAAIDQYYVSHR